MPARKPPFPGARKKTAAASRGSAKQPGASAATAPAHGSCSLAPGALTPAREALLAEALLSMPMAKALEHATQPEEDGGLNLQVTVEEMEGLFAKAMKAAVQKASATLSQLSQSIEEEESWRRISAPVLCLLQLRLQKLLASGEPKADEIKTYFNLLLASRKLDLLERKALENNSEPKEQSEEDKMEMVWDLFALPEEERARRRALWKERQAATTRVVAIHDAKPAAGEEA
jgi:hypothetical protein